LHFPDEDDVFKMAQLWSIDPSELESKDLLPSSGLVGNLAVGSPEDDVLSPRERRNILADEV
jgi:hypothetical protein